MGSEAIDAGPSEIQLDLVRRAIGSVVGCTDFNPVENGKVRTGVRANLLKAWQTASKDPDDQIAEWCAMNSNNRGFLIDFWPRFYASERRLIIAWL